MDQAKSFLNVKHSLVSTRILALYDPNKATKINADASSYGFGCVVLQKQDDGDWKPVSIDRRRPRRTYVGDTKKWMGMDMTLWPPAYGYVDDDHHLIGHSANEL